MARPPLPIGTWGEISVHKASDGYCAIARFRDLDGVTRKVKRVGPTEATAKNNLREELRDRAKQGAPDEIDRETRFSVVADEWMTSIDALVSQGSRSPGTSRVYRLTLTSHVLPALGALRMREITVARLDRFIQTVSAREGAATAKLARTVVSGVVGLAVRHGALPNNPVRDIGRVSARPRRRPRALTPEERETWIARLDADEDAVRKDLPDLCAWMLATGVRIGEALAVSWDEIDVPARTVRIEWTLIRITGEGLLRKSTKSAAGERTLRLPAFVTPMLRRRQLDAGARGPLFPNTRGGWRDPSNTSRDLREARGSDAFAWVTSHVFRKTAATELDAAGLSARQIADQLGHANVSMTQDRYLGRRAVTSDVADALDRRYGCNHSR